MRYLYVFGLLLLVGCYSSERDCEKFRTGTFKWTQEIQGEEVTTTFKRTDQYQIEDFQGQIDTSYIEWVNDCEYRILPKNPKTNAESRAYLFKILRTEGDTYTFSFSQSGDERVFNGAATLVDQ